MWNNAAHHCICWILHRRVLILNVLVDDDGTMRLYSIFFDLELPLNAILKVVFRVHNILPLVQVLVLAPVFCSLKTVIGIVMGWMLRLEAVVPAFAGSGIC